MLRPKFWRFTYNHSLHRIRFLTCWNLTTRNTQTPLAPSVFDISVRNLVGTRKRMTFTSLPIFIAISTSGHTLHEKNDFSHQKKFSIWRSIKKFLKITSLQKSQKMCVMDFWARFRKVHGAEYKKNVCVPLRNTPKNGGSRAEIFLGGPWGNWPRVE